MTHKSWWKRMFESHPEADDLPPPIFVEVPVEAPEKVPHVVHIPVKRKAPAKKAKKAKRGKR